MKKVSIEEHYQLQSIMIVILFIDHLLCSSFYLKKKLGFISQ